MQKLKNDNLIIKDSSLLNDVNFYNNNPTKIENPNNSNMINNSIEEGLI